jgi:glutamate-1-semialdehyde 2,1-aminomutase
MDGPGDPYGEMERHGQDLIDGLRDLAGTTGENLIVQGLGSVFNTTFGSGPIRNYRDYAATDLACQRKFLIALQDRGVRVTSRGTWFLSTAHTDADIDATLATAAEALGAIASA